MKTTRVLIACLVLLVLSSCRHTVDRETLWVAGRQQNNGKVEMQLYRGNKDNRDSTLLWSKVVKNKSGVDGATPVIWPQIGRSSNVAFAVTRMRDSDLLGQPKRVIWSGCDVDELVSYLKSINERVVLFNTTLEFMRNEEANRGLEPFCEALNLKGIYVQVNWITVD